MEYGVPRVRVLVNGAEAESVVSARVESDRSAPIGAAHLALDREDPVAVKAREGAEVEVWMGFLGDMLRPVLRGRVRECRQGRLAELTVQDRMRDLADVRITQAWRNVHLQEVVTWVLERAGVDDYSLSSRETARRHLYIAAAEPVLDVFRRARDTWGVDWDYYADPEGVVWFLPWEESERAAEPPVLDLAWGENLLDSAPRTTDSGEIETYLAPWVRHSQRIRLIEPRIAAEEFIARVERVSHVVSLEHGGRTRLEWKRLVS